MRESNDIISNLALRRMCYILLRTWTEWWLNIRRHIKLAPSPQHLKQGKGKSRKGEKRKRGSLQLLKTEEKEDALFSVSWEESPLQRTLSRTYLAFPNWKQLIVKPYICLPQRQTRHAYARPLQGKLLRLGPGGVLPYKGLMGTCGQPGYVFRHFCLKQGIEFIIFCLNQGIDLSIFVLNRINVLNRVSKIGILS